ncbi:Detected protein of unknown function [Hibiscus syriacus]|uniref:Dof-type domain-containing protein n=1 Tax=Hibiscus syriacus TaxID=106335 RepID=A0A6A2ZR87_HIBSY|nr:Detected protein of unknown function [Hibiscus syriacus]
MSEPKDLAIKLFGKTIPLPEKSSNAVVAATISKIPVMCNGDSINNDKKFDQNHGHCCYTNEETEDEKNILVDRRIENENDRKEDRSKQIDNAPPVASEEVMNPEASDKSNALSIEKEDTAIETCNVDEDQSETSNPEEKAKCNKVLPCPRCNSRDTKFCYYNNYNVSQPRHFCKNCQRYWTAGGTMRNVPVGAGRRKSKNSSSHCRHVIVSEPLRNAPNSTVTFASNTFGNASPTQDIPVSNGVVCSNRSSVPTLSDKVSTAGSHDQTMPSCPSFPPNMPCFPGFFSPYSWNSARWSSPVPPPTFGPPMLFCPTASYWGCSIPTTWNVPWLHLPSSDTQTAPSWGSNSPSLGKHSRDENIGKPNNTGEDEPEKENDGERCLPIPKTLRINDSGDASRSSLFVTSDSKNDGRLFKGFQSKDYERNQVTESNHARKSSSIV